MTTIAKCLREGVIQVYDETGRLHNNNGHPAAVDLDGSQAWFVHGKLHREDGPAFISGNGIVHFWQNGDFLLQDDAEKVPVSVETLRSLYAAAEDARVEQIVLQLAHRYGYPEEAVITGCRPANAIVR